MPSSKTLLPQLALIVLCLLSVGAYQTSSQPIELPDLPLNMDKHLSEHISDQLSRDPLPASDMAKVAALEGISQSASVAEWLGPMAPIALSPFFGIACLCALSQYGADLIPSSNVFLSNNAILNDPTVLWIFIGLTVLTSLPRLTKVSKPLAQAIDQVETYATIITILIIRAYAGSTEVNPEIAINEIQVMHMGLPADALLSIAAIINILVINSVKFFCEVMVWLTPFPFVDALLEAGNKTVCAGLMAIYAFSPTLATILNLLIFATCLVALRWTQRRITWYRSILLDPILAKLRPSFGQPRGEALIVFAQASFGPFPTKARLELTANDEGWHLLWRRWLLSDVSMRLDRSDYQLGLNPGIVTNRIAVVGPNCGSLLFTQRYGAELSVLSEQIAIRYDEAETGNTKTAVV